MVVAVELVDAEDVVPAGAGVAAVCVVGGRWCGSSVAVAVAPAVPGRAGNTESLMEFKSFIPKVGRGGVGAAGRGATHCASRNKQQQPASLKVWCHRIEKLNAVDLVEAKQDLGQYT